MIKIVFMKFAEKSINCAVSIELIQTDMSETITCGTP